MLNYFSQVLKTKYFFPTFYTAVFSRQLCFFKNGKLSKMKFPKCYPLPLNSNICAESKFFSFKSSQKVLKTHYVNKWRMETQFHTSQKHFVPPVIVILLKPLTRIAGVLIGRGARKWWKSLTPEKRKYIWEKIKEQRIKIYVGLGIITGSCILFYQKHLEETPITKRKRFILFDANQFNSIATDIFETNISLYKGSIVPTTHPAYKTVARITDRLLKGNKDIEQIYNKIWSITIVDDPICNAFVLPNGQIFVFTGMLKFCENDDQLGCILGHELAHAILGHSAENLSYSHLVDMVLMVVIALIWAFIPSDMLSFLTHWVSTKVTKLLFELPYNRMLETEADEVGLELATKACYDIREIVVFWKKLDTKESKDDEIPITWLSTHPLHGTRAETLDQLIPKSIEARKKHQCPPLPRLDPRDTIVSYQEWIKKQRAKELETVAVYLNAPVR